MTPLQLKTLRHYYNSRMGEAGTRMIKEHAHGQGIRSCARRGWIMTMQAAGLNFVFITDKGIRAYHNYIDKNAT